MITSILEEMNSPTRVSDYKKNFELFTSEFLDDSDKMIPIEIWYSWDWYTGLGPEKVCCDFDWDLGHFCNPYPGEANISRRDLIEEVKELIREHEKPTEITFY